MNKIGVVTLYGMDNYGNRLQNHAVKTVLTLLRNDKVKELNEINHLLFIKLCKMTKIHLKRMIRFYSFSNKGHDIEFLCDYRDNKYNYIICGSDQIWNPTFAGRSFYFAAFAPQEKRIAYAASFGVSEIPEEKKEEYTHYLSEMKAISVREEAGAKIVKELTGRDAEVLIDPTLMLYKEEWEKVSKKPKFGVGKKYILTYFLGNVCEEQSQYIKNISTEKGYRIINLEGENPNKYWYSTGPAEFIWLIEHCEVMFTDSFHGSVFSVLMDVPFIVFDRNDKQASMSSRIDTLLSTLQLEDRRFCNQSGDKIFEKNYAHIPAILEKERKKAIDYLKNAMELD